MTLAKSESSTMMTTELTGIPSGSLPIDAFKAHLRLAEGFEAIPGQTTRLEACLRASIAALEARLAKIFLSRDFILRTPAWSSADQLRLTLAPVITISSVKIVRSGGEETVLDPLTYGLKADEHRPCLVSRQGAFPMLGLDATAEVMLTAGFGATWEEIPAQLQQAVFMLAESYFEGDYDRMGSMHELPCSVCLLVEQFRDIRLRSLGGSA